MTLVTKSNTFTNGTTADATQVNQDFDTLYNLVNGNLDSSNIATNGVQTSNVASESITPAKAKGLPYSIDLLGTNGFVLSGLTVTKDGTNANKVNIASGVAHLYQTDGTLRRMAIGATSYTTTSANATFYLDLNPDGTFTWGSHSTQPNYITIATVTSDASSNVNVITDTRPTTINLFPNPAGVVNFPGQAKSSGNALAQILSGGYKVQSGTGSIVVTTAGSSVSQTVTFPTSFANTPIVFVTIQSTSINSNTYINAFPNTQSSSSFQLIANSGLAQTIYFNWVAIGS